MIINIKKLTPEATIPFYAKYGDAGMDITATSRELTEDYVEYGTGLSFEVPEDYVMLIFPRSGNSKKDLLLCNSVGVLDSGYRGELKLRFQRMFTPLAQEGMLVGFQCDKLYEVGERIGQIMILPYPKVAFQEVETLSETDRGEGGFGSTGK